MNTFQIHTFLNVDLSIDIAKSYKRYVAFILDWIIKGVYIFVVFSVVLSRDVFSNYWIDFFILTPVYFYTFVTEWLFNGQTPGKMVMRIKVVGVDGNPPSVNQCAVRWMFLFVDAYSTVLMTFISSWAAVFTGFGPLVGIVCIERSKYKQRFGDLAANTYIVNTKEEYHTIEDTIYAYANHNTNYSVMYPDVIRFSDKDMTLVKNLLERSEGSYDYELLEKLSNKIKELLGIKTTQSNDVFLKRLLSDYNYLTMK